MRVSLSNLIKRTIIFKYSLPHTIKDLPRVIVSTDDDKCYLANDSESIKEIIYNSIIDYSFNKFELDKGDFQNLHAIALQTKIKYNPSADHDTKIKYGFFGEVLLYSILYVLYETTPIIARGYFYNPLENSETKGYDSYHLIEIDNNIELWFGEVKFHQNYKSGIDDIFRKIEKALSDDYLNKNILAIISNHKNNLNFSNSMIKAIIESWEKKPDIVIADELRKHDFKLVYPLLVLYEGEIDYDQSIKEALEYINSNYKSISIRLSVNYSIFFIFLPLKGVGQIKSDVILWIESKKELIQ